MFDFGDYLDFARRYVASNATEAEHRSAISRAYYAAFHHTMTCAKSRGVQFTQKADDHHIAENYAFNRDVSAGKLYKALKSMRRRADYEPGYTNASADAPDAVEKAYDIISSIR